VNALVCQVWLLVSLLWFFNPVLQERFWGIIKAVIWQRRSSWRTARSSHACCDCPIWTVHGAHTNETRRIVWGRNGPDGIHWACCYLSIDTSIPVLCFRCMAFHKVLPCCSHRWISFPISIRFPFHPFGDLVSFFQVIRQRLPWLYINLWPKPPSATLARIKLQEKHQNTPDYWKKWLRGSYHPQKDQSGKTTSRESSSPQYRNKAGGDVALGPL